MFLIYTPNFVKIEQYFFELCPFWKAKSIKNQLKIKLMKCLVWTVMTYGAEGWTFKKEDECRIESAEMWCYRRLLRVKWNEKRTNESILQQLQVNRELPGMVIKRKLTFFGHTFRNSKSTLKKDVIQGRMKEKRKQGRSLTNFFNTQDPVLKYLPQDTLD